MLKRYERTRALIEGDPSLAQSIAEDIAHEFPDEKPCVIDKPCEELVMIQVRETAQNSLFYLGEALITSCRVRFGESVGYGLILGSDTCRAHMLAIIDAVFSDERGYELASRWNDVLEAELNRINETEQREARRVATTRVDFRTMEVDA